MEWKEFETTFSVKLNQQQKEAVQSTKGPVLLLAVPGSGKTTVLVTRLGYMIYCKNIPPERILTVTYTVAATKDMSERFAVRFGEDMAKRLEFRTINGICARIIQYYGRRIGKTPFELVKDEKATTGMLIRICQDHGMGYPTESDLKNVRTLITYIKNMMLNEEELQKLEEESDIRIAGIYREYCRQMREQKLMDYDDQMLYAYNMLRKDPGVLAYFQNRYPYICEAADKFIQKNTLRHEKHMRAAREAGADIREISLKSRKAQYVYLMKAAQECTTGMAGMSGSEEHRGRADASVTETAVLYRDNECAIPLIDLLERKNIPYRMRNADLSFFTHRTVLDVQNIIRFAMDPKDTELFMQIYYRLKLFFNKKDALRYAQISQEKDMEVLDAALKYGNLEKYQEDNIRNLKRQMVRILNMPGDEAVNQILTYMGYQDYLKKMGMNVNKLETVKLIGSRVESPEKLLERLEELRTIIQEKVSDKDCPLILSTMHASKGLEYDTVYLLDVMDGILPEKVLANPRTASKEELETYEEERRLFYVGVTRAKNQLNVFTTNKPSKFCSELLGKRNLRENQQKEYAGIKKWGDYSPAGTYGIKGNGMYHGYGTGHGSQKQPGKSYQELADALGEGVIVKHKKFGEGVVVDMEGEHIRIQFGDNVKNMDLKVLARLGMLEI